MDTIVANDLEQHYALTTGAGPDAPALVFVTGMMGLASWWEPQVPAFADRFRVLTYDQRGSGGSAEHPVASIAQLADDLVALLDALGLDRVHLVGHSTGGAIGQVMAIEHGARLASVALCSTVTHTDAYRTRVWDLRETIMAGGGALAYAQLTSLTLYPPRWIRDNYDALTAREARLAGRAAKPAVVSSRITAMRDFDRRADLARIATATLVTCARDDMQTPAYFSTDLAAAIPDAELEIMDWGGHANTLTRPAAFNAIIEGWLARQATP